VAVSEADIALWRSWIGRSERQTELLDAQALRRFASAIGEGMEVERAPPCLAHWAFFLPVCAAAELGEDGHPRRGGFLPPVSLPRRMFAASEMNFGAALRLGDEATLASTIAEVKHKAGKSGDLVFVEVARVVSQHGAECVRELQTIVYRQTGERTPPVQDSVVGEGEAWRPGAVDLFRFSAVTFNSHRIHYDAPYAREVEGYPGLVVQGPFIAAKLFAQARRELGGSPRRFAFRAQAPAFAEQPLYIGAGDATGELKAVRGDGLTAVSATFSA
jgi:3-methylfumaryl-CoA hydratase